MAWDFSNGLAVPGSMLADEVWVGGNMLSQTAVGIVELIEAGAVVVWMILVAAAAHGIQFNKTDINNQSLITPISSAHPLVAPSICRNTYTHDRKTTLNSSRLVPN